MDEQKLATAEGLMRDIRRDRAKIRTLQAETGRRETELCLYAAEHFRDLFADEGDSLDLEDGSVIAASHVEGGPLVLGVCDEDEINEDLEDEQKRFCEKCLCTEDAPCITLDGPCSWVGENLCSACVPVSEPKVVDGLPEECFAVTPGGGELVVIVRGERGYRPIEERALKLLHRGEPAEEARDRLNAYAGVTKNPAAAMLAGSICGWDCRGADPANYDKDGRLRK